MHTWRGYHLLRVNLSLGIVESTTAGKRLGWYGLGMVMSIMFINQEERDGDNMQLELFPRMKPRDLWICRLCGESTYHTEYDYLVNEHTHLKCALEEEIGKDKIDK